MINKKLLKHGICITLLFLCAPPKKIIVPPLPDDFSHAEKLFSKNPLAALEFYHAALSQSPDSLLRHKILTRLYDIYFDQREYPLAYAISESLPEDTLKTLPVVLLSLKKYDEILDNKTVPALTKAYAAEKSGRLEEALIYYEQAEPLVPDYSRLKRAELLYQLNRYDESKRVLLTISEKQEAITLLIDIAFAESSWVEAKRYIDRLPYSDKKLEYLALLQEKQGGNAQAYYWELIEKFPKSPFALQAANRLKPSTISQYYYLGKVLVDSDPKAAENYLKRCLSRGYHKEEVARILGRFYLNQGRTKAAETILQHSRSAEGRFLFARALNRQGLKEEAIKFYLDVFLRFPKSSLANDALFQAGLLLEDSGRPDSACALYLKSNRDELVTRAGILLLVMDKPDKALAVLNKTETAESYYFRAMINEKQGVAVKADSLYQELIKKFPLSYWTMKTLSRPEYESLSPFLNTPIETYLATWTSPNFFLSHLDSLHLNRATVYLEAGLSDEAVTELKLIENNNPLLFYRLSQLCAQFGLDSRSIYYANKITKLTKEKNLPWALIKLLFPQRYCLTIQANNGEIPYVLSVIRQESWFNPQALSSAEALGLMQIIPSTGRAIAKYLALTDFTIEDLNNPELNIKFGIHYLKEMERQFGSKPLALAAYNGGPGNVQRWLKLRPAISEDAFIELIPFNETRNYVKSCLVGDYIYKTILNLQTL